MAPGKYPFSYELNFKKLCKTLFLNGNTSKEKVLFDKDEEEILRELFQRLERNKKASIQVDNFSHYVLTLWYVLLRPERDHIIKKLLSSC